MPGKKPATEPLAFLKKCPDISVRACPATSKESRDHAIGGDVDLLRRRNPGKARHGHDVPSQRYDKARALADPKTPNGDIEIPWHPALLRVVREGELGLCHRDGKLGKPPLFDLSQLSNGLSGQNQLSSMVDPVN